MTMRQLMLGLGLLLVALGLAGCEEDTIPTRTFTYMISDSGGNLSPADGRRVVAVHVLFTGASCGAITGIVGGIQHTGDAVVVTPGTVTLSFTLVSAGPYLETVYIDINGSNTLDSGDKVWGTDVNDAAGPCYNGVGSAPNNFAMDWTTYSPVGTTTYTGVSQPWSTESAPPQIGGGWMTLGGVQ